MLRHDRTQRGPFLGNRELETGLPLPLRWGPCEPLSRVGKGMADWQRNSMNWPYSQGFFQQAVPAGADIRRPEWHSGLLELCGPLPVADGLGGDLVRIGDCQQRSHERPRRVTQVAGRQAFQDTGDPQVVVVAREEPVGGLAGEIGRLDHLVLVQLEAVKRQYALEGTQQVLLDGFV